MGERVRTANADVPIVDLAQQQRERNRQPLAVGRIARERRVKREMRLDSIVLEMVVEEFVDRLMTQMNAQVFALFLDAPSYQRLGALLHRSRRRLHQRAQNQVAVTARFFVNRAKSVSILARKTRDRFA